MELEEGRVATGCDRTTKAVARLNAGPKRCKEFLIPVAGVYPLTVLILIVLHVAHVLSPPPLMALVIGGPVSVTFLIGVITFVSFPLFHKLLMKSLN
jgi:hypothetical protein